MSIKGRALRALYPVVEARFTYTAYGRFLERVDRAPVRVVPMKELESTATWKGVLALRHDVDVRLDSAERFAELEHSYGLRATYYVLHTARYWHDPSLVERLLHIQDLGHEIGLHNDLVSWWVETGDDPREYLRNELQRLRDAGIHIHGSASHGSKLCYRLGYHNNAFFSDFDAEHRPGFPNAAEVETARGREPIPKARLADFELEYEAYHLPYDAYYSDTFQGARRWHPEGLDVAELANRKAVVLTHPCHWDAGVATKTRRYVGELAAGNWRG